MEPGPPQGPQGLDRLNLAIRGFSELERGSTFLIVSAIAGVILIIAVLSMGGLGGSLGALAFALTWSLITSILALMGYVRFRAGGSYFRELEPSRLGKGETGARLIIWGIAVGLPGLFITGIAFFYESLAYLLGIALMMIGGVLSLAGFIFFAIFLFRLNELRYLTGVSELRGFEAAAILWLLGLFLGITLIISVILIYMRSRDNINLLSARAGAMSQP
ncbi:MAG: DUF973 family protein [Desulfurococcales archaeon]|nr:DUF973 family protein [Desulfurococcales archaeon]